MPVQVKKKILSMCLLIHSANPVFCYMQMIFKFRLIINNVVSYRGNLLLTMVSNGQQWSSLLQSDCTFQAPLIFLDCDANCQT